VFIAIFISVNGIAFSTKIFLKSHHDVYKSNYDVYISSYVLIYKNELAFYVHLHEANILSIKYTRILLKPSPSVLLCHDRKNVKYVFFSLTFLATCFFL